MADSKFASASARACCSARSVASWFLPTVACSMIATAEVAVVLADQPPGLQVLVDERLEGLVAERAEILGKCGEQRIHRVSSLRERR